MSCSPELKQQPIIDKIDQKVAVGSNVNVQVQFVVCTA